MLVDDHLQVRVNDELVLNAGLCEEVLGPLGPEHSIRRPDTTLFHQVLDYLRAKPDPPRRPSGSMVGREGVAATALTLRWGSYLAVLLDRKKPAWPMIGSASTSRISDQEMARINIESSAALAEWIDLYRADPGGRLYEQLVNRAIFYLQMPKKTPRLKVSEFAVLSEPAVAARIIQTCDSTRLARIRADAECFPTRIFANALINWSWRNGPVEDIHAGDFQGYPLDQHRLTTGEERNLMTFASKRLALGMSVSGKLAMEQQGRSWCEQVLPYGLAHLLHITPSGWTLTESSRDVRLPICI
jgi:hypothetical protein